MLEGYVGVLLDIANPATCKTFFAVQKTDATDSFLKLLQLRLGNYQERFALEVMDKMVVSFPRRMQKIFTKTQTKTRKTTNKNPETDGW